MERRQLPCWDLRGNRAMSFLGVLIASSNITVLQPGHKKKKKSLLFLAKGWRKGWLYNRNLGCFFFFFGQKTSYSCDFVDITQLILKSRWKSIALKLVKTILKKKWEESFYPVLYSHISKIV